MNFGLFATVAGLVLGVVGVVPIMVAGVSSLLSLRRESQLLGFGRKTPCWPGGLLLQLRDA